MWINTLILVELVSAVVVEHFKFIEVKEMTVNYQTVATSLLIQSQQLTNLAIECNNAQLHQEAEDARKRAKDTTNLAQRVINMDDQVIQELEELQRLINQCKTGYSTEACKSLVALIEKYTLEKTEPYATHLTKCGEL